MTPAALRLANAQAAHIEIEPFDIFAEPQLAAWPLSAPGICRNPMCSKPFASTRDWQRYCSTSCRRMDEQEMRRMGQKAAPALLAWQIGKNRKAWTVNGLARMTPEIRALSNAGRRYVSQLQSEWLQDRLSRAREARL